jgi:3-hydroxybutyryl-CoA dehydrogenase
MKIGIVGSGAMGSGIAQVAAKSGCEVLLMDAQSAALSKGMHLIAQNLDRDVAKNRCSEAEKVAILTRITPTSDLKDLANCDWVIEAIVEDLNIKQKLFQDLEKIVSKSCILATNTSSLSVTALAAACASPERVLGIHFFNPVPIMALVEIIPAVQTKSNLLPIVYNEIKNWNKVPVFTKDTPGFIVNRIARPYYSEALRILDEGIADIQTIDWAMTHFGKFKMGPFALMDFIGQDVNFRVTESMYQSCYHEPRYKPSFTQKRLFEAGFYGKKVGKGFYDYTQPLPQSIENQVFGKLIFNRILIMLINEAADALFWQVATARDIDLAMTKGVNYPKGLLSWADEIGIPLIVHQLDDLYAHYHEERYRCCSLLRQMAKNEKLFFDGKKPNF